MIWGFGICVLRGRKGGYLRKDGKVMGPMEEVESGVMVDVL